MAMLVLRCYYYATVRANIIYSPVANELLFKTERRIYRFSFQINQTHKSKMDLSMETKTKIITLRKYSSATFAEIANQCECGVSRRI